MQKRKERDKQETTTSHYRCTWLHVAVAEASHKATTTQQRARRARPAAGMAAGGKSETVTATVQTPGAGAEGLLVASRIRAVLDRKSDEKLRRVSLPLCLQSSSQDQGASRSISNLAFSRRRGINQAPPPPRRATTKNGSYIKSGQLTTARKKTHKHTAIMHIDIESSQEASAVRSR